MGRRRALGRTAGLHALQLGEDLREDFLYLFTFPDASDAGILITFFYLNVFEDKFVNILISVVAILR